MDPIIRSAVVSSVPRQLRAAVKRVEAVHATPVAAQIAQSVLSTSPLTAQAAKTPPAPSLAPASQPVSSVERDAYAAAVKDVDAQKVQLLQAMKELEDDKAALLAEAESRGLALGQEEGQRQALAQVASKLELLSTLAEEMETSRMNILEQAEDMLVEVAYTAVCRIVGNTAASHAGLLEIVRGIARDGKAASKLCIRLHPQDLRMLQEDDEVLDARITLQADSAVELGGCMVDSDKGTLDARLETQLRRLGDTLLAVRRGRSAT